MKKESMTMRLQRIVFSDIFAHRVSIAEVGIDEVPTFRGKIASIMEMSKMNSYFYKKLTQRFVS